MGFTRNFAWMLGSRVAVMAAAFVTGGLINRALGTAGRGFYAEMQTWTGLFAALFGMSIDTAIYHFANRERYGADDRARFVTTVLLSIGCAVLAALCFTLFVMLRPQEVSREIGSYLVLLDILLVTSMLATNLTVLLQALDKMREAALTGLAQSGVSLAVIIGGYVAGRLTLLYAVVGLIIVQAAALVAIPRIFSGTPAAGGFSGQMARGMLAAGLKQHVATVATFVYLKINQLIVFRYCGESEAGIFAVALNLTFALMFIPVTFQTVLYPRVIHADDDCEVTVRSIRLGFYGWGGMVLIAVLLAEPLLLLYGGSQFLPSVTVFRVLMVAAWFLPLSSLLAPYYVKAGAFGVASVSAAALGVISIGLNLALVPRYAAIGAAAATALTCFTGFCMVLGLLRYLSGMNPLVVFRPDFSREMMLLRQKAGL